MLMIYAYGCTYGYDAYDWRVMLMHPNEAKVIGLAFLCLLIVTVLYYY